MERISNFIGKSNIAGDSLFEGKITDFRIYSRLLDTSELIDINASKTQCNCDLYLKNYQFSNTEFKCI